MIILNKKGNILADCASVYIAPIRDKDNPDKMFCYQVTGVTTTGKSITIKKCNTEEEALQLLEYIAAEFDALRMPLTPELKGRDEVGAYNGQCC